MKTEDRILFKLATENQYYYISLLTCHLPHQQGDNGIRIVSSECVRTDRFPHGIAIAGKMFSKAGAYRF